MSYTVVFSRPAEKEFEKLDLTVARRILPKIKALAAESRPAGCRKIVGEENAWRIRIGDYRVIYTVDERLRAVRVERVRHRSQVYE